MNSNIRFAVNKKAKYLREDFTALEAVNLMLKYSINRLPILDDNDKPTKVLFIESYIKREYKLSNPFIIMAGGKGKRMMPLTKNLPKPMLKINNKPIIQHIIDKAKKEGFINFYISVNYKKKKIINFFKDGKKSNINIKYLVETKSLGTVGPLSLLSKKISKPALITNGDVITDINYKNLIEFHEKKKSDLTLAVSLDEQTNPFGIVNTIGFNVKQFIEKPITRNYINTGVYVISPKIINLIKKNTKLDIQELIKNLLIKKKRVLSYPIHEKWIDIGNKSKLELMNAKKNL